MTLGLKDIATTTEFKFGRIYAAAYRGSDYVLLIERDDPALKSRPFMTIIGYRRSNDDYPAFDHGHYDMTEEQAHTDFEERRGA